jgi:hypothetical protein
VKSYVCTVRRGAIGASVHRCIITVPVSVPLCDWSLPSLRAAPSYIAVRKTSLLLRMIRVIQEFILRAARASRSFASFMNLLSLNDSRYDTRLRNHCDLRNVLRLLKKKSFIYEQIDRDCNLCICNSTCCSTSLFYKCPRHAASSNRYPIIRENKRAYNW